MSIAVERARRLAAAVGPAALLVVIALWETCAAARAGHDVPGDAAWARAADAVRAEHRAGDLLTFAPRWVDPVGRLHLGDLIPLDMAFRMDAARYGTIWELSIRGARSPDTRGLDPVSDQTFGGVRVRKYVREPAEVVTDFLEARPEPGAGRVEYQEVGFEPHRCVMARPTRGETVVTYRNVALGARLVGYAGIADVFTRRDDRRPAELQVLVDGEPRAAVALGVDDGWVRFELDTQPRASAEVAFRVTSESHGRQVCFAAEARR